MSRKLLIALLVSGGVAVAACGDLSSPAAPAVAPESAALKRVKATDRAPYIVQFSGDLESAPVAGVMLDPSNPLGNLSHTSFPLTLSAAADLEGCGLTGGSWSPHAGSYTGYLTLSAQRGGLKLSFYAPTASGTWVAVSVEDDVVPAGASVAVVDGAGFAKEDTFPMVIVTPCVSFTVTATPQ